LCHGIDDIPEADVLVVVLVVAVRELEHGGQGGGREHSADLEKNVIQVTINFSPVQEDGNCERLARSPYGAL
jgi:hypothetical protein